MRAKKRTSKARPAEKPPRAIKYDKELTRTLDRISDGFISLDKNWRFTYLNRRAMAVMSIMGKTRKQLLGHGIWDVFPYLVGSPLYHHFHRTMSGQVPVSFERFSDRLKKWHEFHVYPSPSGLTIYFQETTKRKQAEELRTQMAAIVESSDEAIVGESLDGVITSWNQGAEKIYGYSAAEIIGKSVTVLAPPERVAEIRAFLAKIARGERIKSVETVRLRKDGRRIQILLTVSPIHNDEGELTGASAISHDITELKDTEDLLKKSEERFHVFMDHSPAVAWMKDGNFKFTYVNAAFERRFDVRLEDIRGKDDFDFWPRAIAEELRAHDLTVLSSGKPLETYENVPTPDGQMRFWYVLKFPFAAGHGQKFVGGTAVDLTERKRAEDLLSSQKEELVRSNSDLEQFAYVASHDLKEPLRAISSYLQLLENKCRGKLDSEEESFIQVAINGSIRMNQRIEDLLAYSRLGRANLDFKMTDCSEVIRHVLNNLAVKLEETGASVTWDPLPRVMAIESEFAQLIENLLMNALKFKGADPPRVHISSQQKNGEWIFSVRDNGIGIDPQYYERIFKIFQRLHAREEYPGTGIGLAICKKIVEYHGGRIWVESQPDRGSTFYFSIPEKKEDSDQDGTDAGPLGILLVEDNKDDARLTGEALKATEMDYSLTVVDDGEKALKFLRQQEAYARAPRPDLIVLDLNLPKIDGRQVLAEVQADEDLKHIPVVILTTSKAEESVLNPYKNQANCYMTKPMGLNQMLEVGKSIERWFKTVRPPK